MFVKAVPDTRGYRRVLMISAVFFFVNNSD